VLDQYTATGNETAGYAILFAICASAYLVSFVIHHLLSPRLEPLSLK
jgi:ACS family hexuronate transporter-like MFS transporter